MPSTTGSTVRLFAALIAMGIFAGVAATAVFDTGDLGIAVVNGVVLGVVFGSIGVVERRRRRGRKR